MSKPIHGIPVSRGIAFGQAYVIQKHDLSFDTYSSLTTEEELTRLQTALIEAEADLVQIQDKIRSEQGAHNAAILDAQILALHDPELMESVEGKIKMQFRTAENAFQEATSAYINLFAEMDDEYMQERASDLKDIMRRVLLHLLGIEERSMQNIEENSIIIADDVTPSETAQMDLSLVRGFITNQGGSTSHSAIMAQTLEVPAIVGTRNSTTTIRHGDFIMMNGMTGEVFVNPVQTLQASIMEQYEKYKEEKRSWQILKNKPTTTKDGNKVELFANIGIPQDVNQVLQHGAEGIGLYRTEFLYMETNALPTEEEQFEAYKYVLEKMGDKPVTVRTIDIGGDKKLPYLPLPEEKNPFLGLRAVRFALQEPDIFRTQIRALLRASAYGNLKIMFPMIATLEEFHQAKAMVTQEKEYLATQKVPMAENIDIGIMVEIPSTAILAKQFAKEVDFFSIGTNDLIQYTLAADRMNENVAYLYQPFHPSILQLVKNVIEAAHAENKPVGMCGEMAGNITAIPVLLGLGLDEFSMNSPAILPVRDTMRNLHKTDMKVLANQALTLRTAEEVKQFVEQTLHK